MPNERSPLLDWSRVKRALDLGCGNGNSVQALSEIGYDVLDCDMQSKQGPHREQLQRQRLIRPQHAECSTSLPMGSVFCDQRGHGR